jgi:dTDP-4-amino-4,6-dideoxygalactose transaminase
MKTLAGKGVDTKIYFPPVHLQPYYRTLGFKKVLLPITEKVAKDVLSLPLRPTLSDEDAEYVIDSIKNIIER